jgi:hypothetical protein
VGDTAKGKDYYMGRRSIAPQQRQKIVVHMKNYVKMFF